MIFLCDFIIILSILKERCFWIRIPGNGIKNATLQYTYRASKVFPVPGGPIKRQPLGSRPPEGKHNTWTVILLV